MRWLAIFTTLLAGYYFLLPKNLFTDPCSTVLLAADRELLSASIAKDGQWRFPESPDVPEKFAMALVHYEDKRFYKHPGVDVLALARATWQDINARAIVSGGSTLSMQVIRLSRKGKGRTLREKVIEIVLATRLEWRYSKEEILALYASHAPFGGNVVGLDAACWRYFGRPASQLSWGEASLLAVLPNAPGMIHPGRNRESLRVKRNGLLDRLRDAKVIDDETAVLAKHEHIPEAPQPLPRLARHLLVRAEQDAHRGTVVHSTIDRDLQQRVETIVADHHGRLRAAQIHNLSALVLDVESGGTLAYVGNIPDNGNSHEADVDVITAPRSTGSILKPFLYAAMLDEGKILPRSLLPDVPTMINGFVPRNFTRQYDGAVAANEALIRSLNVPAVHMLRTFRYQKFYNLLRDMGMRTLNRPADHYGLALILGGAEGTLWDVAGMYASMARTLNHFERYPGANRYERSDFRPPVYEQTPLQTQGLQATSWLSAASICHTFNALTELSRPAEVSGWRHFTSARKIAWKTGTSFGYRDGWAIGVTPTHVVAVWVGNADGEGRPGLTGTDAAAPVMFDIFAQLKGASWFAEPRAEMKQITICAQSGQRVGEFCPSAYSAQVVSAGLSSAPCSYHRQIHLTHDRRFRLHRSCATGAEIETATWFILPPLEEYFYRGRHLSFKPLPPFRSDCETPLQTSVMSLVYPKPNAKIIVPRELDGREGSAIFELAHRNPEIIVHWHVDGTYVGSTSGKHVLPLNPSVGPHILTLVDENGASIQQRFVSMNGM